MSILKSLTRLTMSIALIGVAPPVVDSLAASYDCANAKLPTEMAICKNHDIGILDEQLAAQYRKLGELLSKPQRSSLGKRQLAFVGARNSCGDNESCISKSYQIRNDELCRLAQIIGHPCAVTWVNMTAKDKPQLDYCHMDECSWFVVREKKKIAQNIGGELFEVHEIEGDSSHYPNFNDDSANYSEYPDKFSEAIPINWSSKENVDFVFCSKILPTVIYNVDGKLTASPLDFGGEGIFGYNSNEAGYYTYVCTGLEPSSYNANGFAAKFGFKPLPAKQDINIEKPTDILAIAEKMAHKAN